MEKNIDEYVYINSYNIKRAIDDATYQRFRGNDKYKKADLEHVTKLEFSFIERESLYCVDSIFKNIDSVSELKELSKLNNLKIISFIGFNELNLNNLPEIESLESISIEKSAILNLEGIQKFPNLKYIYIKESDLQSFFGLDNPLLEQVVINNCKLAEINEIQNCRELIVFEAKNNNIRYLSHLEKLSKIWRIDLSHNNIENIEPLAKCVSLSRLELNNNNIKDISYISKLTNLETLSLKDNKIKDIESLMSLKKLRTLNLSSNRIAHIQSLQCLDNLWRLHLDDNAIQNASILNKNNFPNLSELRINNNNISESTNREITFMFNDSYEEETWSKEDINEYYGYERDYDGDWD